MRAACGACGQEQVFEDLPRDPTPRYFKLGFNPFAMLGRWRDFARVARETPNQIILGPCERCEMLITLHQEAPVSLVCKSCGGLAERQAGQHIMDLFPQGELELRAATGREWFHISWKVEVHIAEQDEPSECPGCGALVPAFVGAGSCPHCEGALEAWSRCGKRFFPGMVVHGNDKGVPCDGWMPLEEALALYEEKHRAMAQAVETAVGLFKGKAKVMVGCFLAFVGLFVALFLVALVLALMQKG